MFKSIIMFLAIRVVAGETPREFSVISLTAETLNGLLNERLCKIGLSLNRLNPIDVYFFNVVITHNDATPNRPKQKHDAFIISFRPIAHD